MELLFQQQGIGTQRYELLARHDALDDLTDLFVNKRLAARDGDPRGAAFIAPVEAFLHREPLVKDRIRIIDLAASKAGQIATEQGLQHQHKRIALAAELL